jgi:hypothetical protein
MFAVYQNSRSMHSIKQFLLLVIIIISRDIHAQTADDVINGFIKFSGGEKYWKKVHSIVTSGIYNYGGTSFPFTSYSKAPDLYKFVVPYNGKYFMQAYNGKNGWKIDAFNGDTVKTILTGKDALAMMNEADVELESPFINYQKKKHQVLLEGIDIIENQPCYKLKLLRHNGNEETYFFGTSQFKPFKKLALTKNAEQGNSIIETYFSDYHTVQGITVPYKMVYKSKEQIILIIEIMKFTLNAPVTDESFN